MTSWVQYSPTRIIFGRGETQNVGNSLSQTGHRSVLLVADPFMAHSGVADKLVAASQGIIRGVYSDVDPNPTVHNVNGAVAAAKKIQADGIVALGGGSVIDASKAAAAAIGSDVSAEDLVTGSPVSRALPIIAVPTTAGTGSEVTPVAIISWEEKDIKFPLGSPLLFPELAIVDSTLVYSAPPRIIATAGVDVIAHCLDALSSVKHTPLSDMNALNGAEIAFANLEKAVNDKDHDSIDAMMLASLIAGLAFSQTGTTGSHAASYYLTSKYGVPHGEATAFTEDAWIRVNAQARPEINTLLQRIGFKDADEAADRLNVVKANIGMRMTLEEINVPLEDIEIVAQKTLEANNYKNNVAQLSLAEVVELLRTKSAQLM
ncbi:iron-containing alcohol dehydrogenase [Actinomycetaceae bacterium WB03_NA08]|uniref:Iron-containing alcohol dehydrogenase n=1 Tax=Scrofimicrobium canadense TaxID=2652290 RepID=A0A6N7VUF2_9ACTO|nr:iron-containing alcohol dehydrogenase [Scrofimicrobium canadense]MSS84610.1 iron-containing alcohol dehydrogenase [Scrofimicrobium canadense]